MQRLSDFEDLCCHYTQDKSKKQTLPLKTAFEGYLKELIENQKNLNDDEKLMLKYQETFKRVFSNKIEFDVEKIEKIM